MSTEDMFISWSWDGLDRINELIEKLQEFRELWNEKGVARELQEIRNEIERIEDLKEKQKRLAKECAELDYPESEIAEMSGLSPATVNRLL